MAEVASAFVSLMPSARGFGSKLDSQIGPEVDSAGKRAGKRLGTGLKVGALAALGGAAIAGAFLKDAVAGAGELEQSVGAIDTVFGKSATKMHKWSKAAAQNVGLTQNEFNELGTLIGSQLKNGGTAMDQLAPKTKDLITAGADLSSMFGGSTKEAVEALSSALKGERDPIERYGVSLNQAKIDAEAAALGFKKIDGAWSDQAKQAATLSLITKQTSDAQGNFAKESGTLAGQQQRLSASWGNMKTTLGSALLPAITSVVTGLNDLGTTFQKEGLSGVASVIGQKIQEAVPVIKANLLQWGAAFVEWVKDVYGPLLVRLGGLWLKIQGWIWGTALPAIAAALVRWGKAFVEWIGPQISPMLVKLGQLGARLFNWLLSTGLPRLLSNLKKWGKALVEWVTPMIPPLLREAGKLLGKLVAWVLTTGIPKLLGAMLKLGVALVQWIAPQVPKAVAAMLGLVGKLAGWVVSTGLPMLASKLRAMGTQAFQAFKEAAQKKLSEAIDFVKGIPAKVVAVFAGAATMLYNAGSQLMSGLAAGIRDKIADAINEVKAGLGKIRGLLPGSPIKWGPLKNWNNGGAGKRLMDLVTKGITAATPKTVKAAQSAFSKISDSLSAERDKLRGTLDGLKSDFSSLSDSVSSSFLGDLFNPPEGTSFVDNLFAKKAQLTGLLSSFKTLQGWGLDPAFLSQLFASGNGALITELAGMGQAGAVSTGALFGEVASLGSQLGDAVAQNDVGPRIDETNKQLERANKRLEFLAEDIGRQLNSVAAQVARKSKKGDR